MSLPSAAAQQRASSSVVVVDGSGPYNDDHSVDVRVSASVLLLWHESIIQEYYFYFLFLAVC